MKSMGFLKESKEILRKSLELHEQIRDEILLADVLSFFDIPGTVAVPF